VALDSLKILLLQARDAGDHAKADERQSFADRAGVSLDQVVSYDLLDGPPSLNHIRKHDTVTVGGSGDYYVSKGNLPDFDGLLSVLREVVDVGHPVFASCFGFQLIVQALGGEIILDTARTEVGTYLLELKDAGAEDELFKFLPRRFRAQLGHKDQARRLPSNSILLASSDNSPYQAIRFPGKPIWATQFHPELTGAENRARFLHYLKGYVKYMDDGEQERTLSRFDESPEAEQLIPRFLKLVFD